MNHDQPPVTPGQPSDHSQCMCSMVVSYDMPIQTTEKIFETILFENQKMNLHGGFKEMIVFESWMTNYLGGQCHYNHLVVTEHPIKSSLAFLAFIGSCIGLILVAIVYEGIKLMRQYVMKMQLKNS